MKKKLLILSIILCSFTKSFGQDIKLAKSSAGNITFTDINFKNALINHKEIYHGVPIYIDSNRDGEISYTEAAAAEVLGITNKNIKNLEGIEYFTNLKKLLCSYNEIKEINTSTLTSLNYLIARNNKITSIDVRNCKLDDLDLSNNPLEYAYLAGRNTFTSEYYGMMGYESLETTFPDIKYICLNSSQFNLDGAFIYVDIKRKDLDLLKAKGIVHVGECTIQTPIINFDTYFTLTSITHDYISLTLINSLDRIRYTPKAQIFDIRTGKLMKTIVLPPDLNFQKATIDCNDLPTGYYIFKIDTNKGVFSKKFQKAIKNSF